MHTKNKFFPFFSHLEGRVKSHDNKHLLDSLIIKKVSQTRGNNVRWEREREDPWEKCKPFCYAVLCKSDHNSCRIILIMHGNLNNQYDTQSTVMCSGVAKNSKIS